MGITYSNNQNFTYYYYRAVEDSTHDTDLSTVNGTVSSGDVFKVTRENGVLKAYQNDVLKKTITEPSTPYNNIALQGYENSRWTQIKNLKIREL